MRLAFIATAAYPPGTTIVMGHQESYLHNDAYAGFLATQDEGFFTKYADTLQPARPGGRVLDVGCGVGQVVRRWKEAGLDAYGVEVSEPSVKRAREAGLNCAIYDGGHLPFPDGHFAAAGALNVLEHVEEPEAFIPELVRVVEPGGRIVISSPNFLRVLGWRDYHHSMRGLRNKWLNLRRLLAKRQQMQTEPDTVRFDRMEAVFKEPFEPDDDAIIATNTPEIAFFLERTGCVIEKTECTDRCVPGVVNFCLNLTPLRHGMFNAFVVARKRA